MTWDYEAMYRELSKVDSSLNKEDTVDELKRIESVDGPSVQFSKGHELWEILEQEYGFTVPIRFMVGEDLRGLCSYALTLKNRDVYYEMEKYCEKNTHSKIGVLFGLRSTGKTIILQQLAGREDYLRETAYTTLRYRQCKVWELEGQIKKLQAAGIKYVFIDEICYAEDFVEYCAGLADWFPAMKIIVSGTDSLSFRLASHKAWFHRTETVSTTKMSYPEFNRVIGGDILAYVRHGGIFEYTGFNVKEYINSSVVDNIHNSLMNMHENSFGKEVVRSLTKQELYNIVYAISESLTEQFIRSRIAELWGKKFAHGLSKALADSGIKLTPKEYKDVIDQSYPYTIESTKYDKGVVDTILMYLLEMDYLTKVPFRGSDGTLYTSLVLTQMKLLRGFTDNVLSAVAASSSLSPDERLLVSQTLESHSDGSILEPIVILALLNTPQAGKIGTLVEKFRAADESYEIDTVVYVPGKKLSLIEVKRSDKKSGNHAKHICDPKVREAIKRVYKNDIGRSIILYRGETLGQNLYLNEHSVEYVNLEEFLTDIEKTQLLP